MGHLRQIERSFFSSEGVRFLLRPSRSNFLPFFFSIGSFWVFFVLGRGRPFRSRFVLSLKACLMAARPPPFKLPLSFFAGKSDSFSGLFSLIDFLQCGLFFRIVFCLPEICHHLINGGIPSAGQRSIPLRSGALFVLYRDLFNALFFLFRDILISTSLLRPGPCGTPPLFPPDTFFSKFFM